MTIHAKNHFKCYFLLIFFVFLYYLKNLVINTSQKLEINFAISIIKFIIKALKNDIKLFAKLNSI